MNFVTSLLFLILLGIYITVQTVAMEIKSESTSREQDLNSACFKDLVVNRGLMIQRLIKCYVGCTFKSRNITDSSGLFNPGTYARYVTREQPRVSSELIQRITSPCVVHRVDYSNFCPTVEPLLKCIELEFRRPASNVALLAPATTLGN